MSARAVGTSGASGTSRASRARRAAVVVGAAAVLAPLLAGCGIRTTSVPVDAGPAPSRVSCAPPPAPPTTDPDEVNRQVYLVCSMQVAPVTRSVPYQDVGTARSGPASQAAELIRQLQRSPRGPEAQAGFSTAVPSALEVMPPRPGDPKTALRLNQELDDLPSFALAQIVCTLTSDPVVAPGGSVLLGGYAVGDQVHGFTCTPDLRTRPDAGEDAGTPVR